MSWPPRANSIDLSGAWEIRRDDSADWRDIRLPGAWQHVLGTDFHGVAWYRRTIDLPDEFRAALEAGRRLWLRFESVATDITAWVNGEAVGRHVGDYVPFQFEITAAVGDRDSLDVLFRVDEIHAPRPEKEGDLQHGHITKGFHDVISLQHGGIWQPLHLAHTGNAVAMTDGIVVRADASTGEVALDIEYEPGADHAARIEAELFDPAEGRIGELPCRVDAPRLWSPDEPALHRIRVRLFDERGESESHDIRFGFRTFRAEGQTILLNDRPIMIRGVLDWGHEPEHLAPAPPPDVIRGRFAQLKAMGFNTVCLCMWYPPRWFFDIADETGMLIWQEHPVWQSPMRDADVEEYKRLFAAFLRRDRNRPSVAIVSATCEHPCFHPELADWWWRRANNELPHALLELQTAFFKWADLEKTDLYDEHTYDNSNRWVGYIDDVRAHLDGLPPKPFVMGETIVFSSWPDVGAIRGRIGESRPWWLPRAFDHMGELEVAWRERYGDAVAERFRKQSDRYHFRGRKFQVERFRDHAGNAGLVMNHLRDVPACQCGFVDDADRWRFEPESTRGWLGDSALLLWTPDHRRAFAASEVDPLPCEIALSNFAGRDFDGDITLTVTENGHLVHQQSIRMRCGQGEVRAKPLELALPAGAGPRRITIEADADGIHANCWDVWTFPDPPPPPDASSRVFRLDALPFTDEDAAPDDVEKGYSRGYGLPVRNWVCAVPDPGRLVPGARPWDGDAPPPDMRLLLTHRLTRPIVDWLARGGRAILFASKAPGGLGTSYEWLFGAVPLVVEEGPLVDSGGGDSEWIVDLLGYDLVRRYCRVIPTESLGIADRIDPLIRLVYTHDQQQRVRFFDLLFQARVGDGHLLVSSLDHSEAAGRFLLHRMIEFMSRAEITARGALDPEFLLGATYERQTR